MLLCVIKEVHCGKSSPCPFMCVLAQARPVCFSMCIHVCIDYVYILCAVLQNDPGHSLQAKTTAANFQTLFSQLRPCTAAFSQGSVPHSAWSRGTRSLWRPEHTLTHTHKQASRPGRDKVPGSRDRGLDGKRHSFTCCYFQI